MTSFAFMVFRQSSKNAFYYEKVTFFCLTLFGLLPAAACLNCRVWSKKIVVNIKAIQKCVPQKNIATKVKNVRYEQILSLDHRHRHHLHRHRHRQQYNIFCCILCVFIFQHFSLKFISIRILSHSQLDRMHLFLNDFFLLFLDVSVLDFDVYAYLSPTKNLCLDFDFDLDLNLELRRRKNMLCVIDLSLMPALSGAQSDGVAVALEMFVTFKK